MLNEATPFPTLLRLARAEYRWYVPRCCDPRPATSACPALRIARFAAVRTRSTAPDQTDAQVADRRTRGNRHPCHDLVLGISQATLAASGVQPGALLAVTGAGAKTIAVTCTKSCRVRYIAEGPSLAHIEGHVVFEAANGAND